jgi:16S rRNA (cytosine1402-N4)-methyltransferase
MTSFLDRSMAHTPVLLREAVDALRPHPGGRYIDGTFGGGGHTRRILEASAPDGIVLAFDRDPEAATRAETLQRASFADRLIFEHASFRDLEAVARRHVMVPVDGVLLDLGVSSFQLDSEKRGFSFQSDGPLDMRFDTESGRSASGLIATLDEPDLADILWRFGEERQSRRIARAIVERRKKHPVETTKHLADLVEQAVGGRRGSRTHPATRTFQALRIAVNDELTVLAKTLPQAVEVLGTDGRLVVISFHSLEDRIVKQFMRRESAHCLCPPEQPVCTCGHRPRLRLIGGSVKPSAAEIASNPRSRSAIMRVAERLPEGAA